MILQFSFGWILYVEDYQLGPNKKVTSWEEITDECTISKDGKGNLYLQFILQNLDLDQNVRL